MIEIENEDWGAPTLLMPNFSNVESNWDDSYAEDFQNAPANPQPSQAKAHVENNKITSSSCKEPIDEWGSLEKEDLRSTSKSPETDLAKGEKLSLIHICRCRRYAVCRSRWSPYH
eukprot:TRINITY_DN4072_c0_g2_i1.p3 TRINITY_DN4072_c0_g2~~TRINITY_DN4072_c0_g2_i1.p3  ORF type:complete len:115 (-),score=24.57 TRINITY_DN4072_c0_g2_i1:10-354(-)